MKRFTQRTVEGFMKQLGHINARQKPQSFPGKAPTRMFIAFRNGKLQIKYLGKPNRYILEKLLSFNHLKKENYYLLMVEFDRGGLISYARATFNKADQNFANHKLYANYHSGMYLSFWPLWMRYKYNVVNNTYKVL